MCFLPFLPLHRAQGMGKGHPLAQGVPVHVATLASTWPKRFETHGCAYGSSHLLQSRSWRCWPSSAWGKWGVVPHKGQADPYGGLSLQLDQSEVVSAVRTGSHLLGQFWVQQVCSSTSSTSHTLGMREGEKHRAAFPHHIPQGAAVRAVGMPWSRMLHLGPSP